MERNSRCPTSHSPNATESIESLSQNFQLGTVTDVRRGGRGYGFKTEKRVKRFTHFASGTDPHRRASTGARETFSEEHIRHPEPSAGIDSGQATHYTETLTRRHETDDTSHSTHRSLALPRPARHNSNTGPPAAHTGQSHTRSHHPALPAPSVETTTAGRRCECPGELASARIRSAARVGWREHVHRRIAMRLLRRRHPEPRVAQPAAATRVAGLRGILDE